MKRMSTFAAGLNATTLFSKINAAYKTTDKEEEYCVLAAAGLNEILHFLK